LKIGCYAIDPPVILAPMAGITDTPMRQICRRFGAGYAVSEMLASDPALAHTRKSQTRRNHEGEPGPIGVQIAGSDPAMLADAARFNVDHGAQIIDINMGCPAKKVLQAWAGSALLENERLVGRILDAVVAAVAVPVTLKIRTGPDAARRNGVAIARIAEAAGIAALAVHGRTRVQRFEGRAEHRTVAEIRHSVAIPVIANGDIQTAADALHLLTVTGADAVMIGRAALGRPWLFGEIAAALAGRPLPAPPDDAELAELMREHLCGLHRLYGERQGVRIARKHVGWYLSGRAHGESYRAAFNQALTACAQFDLLDDFAAGFAAPRHVAESAAAA
jgi:tRNA-dihydrouridine synthase B